MKPDIFFKNFEFLADAPNGVQKLRELILQLAVRGKLVPQDPEDESASILLEKIKAEKKRLIKEKKLKREEPLPSIESKDVPFEIPKTWKWVYLRDVGQIVGGGTPTTSQSDYFSEGGIVWLTPADLYNLKEKFVVKGRRDLSELGLQKSSAQLMPAGTVLFSSRAPIGYVAIAATDLATNQGFKSCVPFIMEMNEFIYYFLKYGGKEIDQNASGTTFKEVSGKVMSQVLFPLPPLAEQKRIVSKVDELMALCDKLETRRQKKQELQSKLNSAALDGILNAENKEEFEQHWQRICENFDLLYDNPENVEKLRQVVLQLAVQGKLVPQNPEDEPASFLIDKIDNEKRNLVKVGKIKGINSESLEVADEIPILPENWELVKLDSIILFMDAGWSPACKNHPTEDEKTWGVLKTTSVQSLTFLWTEHKELPENLTPRPEYEVRAGDILITRAGPKKRVGICCLVKDTRSHLMISDKIIRFHLLDEFVFPEFVTLCLNTGFSQRIIESQKSGMAESQMNISQSKLRMTPIPLPPLAEQKRIVEKVEQLMGLCDELESKLRKEKGDSEKLMEAVVKGLLEGKETEKTELEEPIPLQVATIQLK